jgi:hypothetical protein
MSHTFSSDEIKAEIESIAREYGVGRLALFGSYARGKATDEIDRIKPRAFTDTHFFQPHKIWQKNTKTENSVLGSDTSLYRLHNVGSNLYGLYLHADVLYF